MLREDIRSAFHYFTLRGKVYRIRVPAVSAGTIHPIDSEYRIRTARAGRPGALQRQGGWYTAVVSVRAVVCAHYMDRYTT